MGHWTRACRSTSETQTQGQTKVNEDTVRQLLPLSAPLTTAQSAPAVPRLSLTWMVQPIQANRNRGSAHFQRVLPETVSSVRPWSIPKSWIQAGWALSRYPISTSHHQNEVFHELPWKSRRATDSMMSCFEYIRETMRSWCSSNQINCEELTIVRLCMDMDKESIEAVLMEAL